MVELNQSLAPTSSVELQKFLHTDRSASCCISSSRSDCEMDVILPIETFSMGMPLMRTSLQSATPMAEEAAASAAASAASASASASAAVTTTTAATA
jgi:hypothetical protein